MKQSRTIAESIDSIALPAGLECRLQEKIDAALETPMRERKVILKPKRNRWALPVLGVAAALSLLLLGILSTLPARAAREGNTLLIDATEPEITLYAALPTASEEPKKFDDELYYQALYWNTLELYRNALARNLDAQGCRELGISELVGELAGEDERRNLGYALEDLNGDGLPELLIGYVRAVLVGEAQADPNGGAENALSGNAIPADSGSDCLIDLYQLCGTKPVLIAQSGEDGFWYDCGDGKLKREKVEAQKAVYTVFRMRDEPLKEGIRPTAIWQMSVFSGRDETIVYLDTLDPESFSLEFSSEITPEEGRTLLARDFGSISHRFLPLETESPSSLSEEESRSMERLLAELETRREPFSLSAYADGSPEGLILLLEQMERYASEAGLTPEQTRGLLLGRENLDAASAEAYAVFLGKIYPLSPAVFLQAWHDAGEPAELMHHVTGVNDPELSQELLREYWKRTKASSAAFEGLRMRTGENDLQSEAEENRFLKLILLKAEEKGSEGFLICAAEGSHRSLLLLCEDDGNPCALSEAAP